MDRIFGALNVVDNWDAATWQTVSASNGTQGAGGGTPRVSWAPEFGPDTVPPVTTASLSGASGAANWYTSPVSVTLAATDDSSGVAAIHFRTDGGPWSLFVNPVTVLGEGSHAIDYYATDVAGIAETMRGQTIRITGDLHSVPVSTLSSSGLAGANGWYVSPVTVTITATSAGGLATSIAVRIDGGAWITYGQPFT